MAAYGDAVVSHTWENAQNYLYYELLYGDYPLIHNSPFLGKAGYFYPDFDCQAGGRALLKAFTEHDANLEAYREQSRHVLSSVSIYNPRTSPPTRTRSPPSIATRDAPPFPDSDMNARPSLTRAKWLIGCAVASIALGARAIRRRIGRRAAPRLGCGVQAARRRPVRRGMGRRGPFVKRASSRTSSRPTCSMHASRSARSAVAAGRRSRASATRMRRRRPTGFTRTSTTTTLTSGATVYEAELPPRR